MFLQRFLQSRFRASVLKNHGVDIGTKPCRYNKKEKRVTFERRATNYVVVFQFPFDDDLKVALGLSNITIRFDGYGTLQKSGIDDIIVVSYKDLEDEIRSYEYGEYNRLLPYVNEEERARVQEEKKARIARLKAKVSECELVSKLTKENTKTDFIYLLSMLKYDPDDVEFCWEAYNKEWTDFPGQPLYVKDNRAFYVYDEEHYLVVSKNLYDVFFASQGNGFESCFSLTSDHRFITGAPFWNAHDGFYMVYLTKGTVSKWSAIPGHKLKLPQMSMRAWGYNTNAGFSIGKHYGKIGADNEKILSLFGAISYRQRPSTVITSATPNRMRKYKTFYDNIGISDSNIYFNPDYGDRGNGGRCDVQWSCYSELEKVNYSENVDYSKDMIMIQGRVENMPLLRKSKLRSGFFEKLIEENLEEGESFGSMYLDVSGKSMCVHYSKDCGPVFVFRMFLNNVYLKKGDEDERLVATL